MSNLNSLLAYSYFLYGWLNLISVYTPQVLLSSSIDGSVLQKKHNVPCKPIYPKLQNLVYLVSKYLTFFGCRT